MAEFGKTTSVSSLSPCFVFGQKVERAKKEKRKGEKARRGNGQKLAVGTAAVQRERQSRERTGRMTSERACMDGNVREERRAEQDLQNETGEILRSHAAILEKFGRKICRHQLLPPPPRRSPVF